MALICRKVPESLTQPLDFEKTIRQLQQSGKSFKMGKKSRHSQTGLLLYGYLNFHFYRGSAVLKGVFLGSFIAAISQQHTILISTLRLRIDTSDCSMMKKHYIRCHLKPHSNKSHRLLDFYLYTMPSGLWILDFR